MIVSRRTALGVLAAMPAALRALAQGQTQAQTAVRLRRFVTLINGYCVIEPDGRVKVWTDRNGVKGSALGLGHDRVVAPFVAQEAPTLAGATSIAEGYSAFAVLADGRVIGWGTNANGLLANTPLSELEVTAQPHPPVPTPTPTLPMPKIIDIATLGAHVVALAADGTVFTWGNGQAGQLGVGDLPIINFKTHTPASMAYVPFPIHVPGLTKVVAIAAGSKHSMALLKDGSISAWGENQYGQLGDGTIENRTRPGAVRGITNAIAIDSSGDFSAAVLADGTVMTWGLGSEALGRPGIASRSANSTPLPVPGLTGVTAIACGGVHMLALTGAGRVIAWGHENVYKPVGHPGIPPERPAAVPLVTNARAVFAGSLSSQVLLADGTFMVWGATPSLSFHVDHQGYGAINYPIPMVVKGL